MKNIYNLKFSLHIVLIIIQFSPIDWARDTSALLFKRAKDTNAMVVYTSGQAKLHCGRTYSRDKQLLKCSYLKMVMNIKTIYFLWKR